MMGEHVFLPGMMGEHVFLPGMMGKHVFLPGMMGEHVFLPGMMGEHVFLPGMSLLMRNLCFGCSWMSLCSSVAAVEASNALPEAYLASQRCS
jgi:hypothetical protein